MASAEDSGSDGDDEPSDRDRLPQADFPDQPLVHNREQRPDGSERCLVYPADAAPKTLRTTWLAVDASAVVSLDERR
ncbi:MAG: hypothetical protein ABEI96_09730 [Haloarculaceae archaeon]